jgi:hypothetical protein
VGFYLESDFSQETETNHWQEVITQSQMLWFMWFQNLFYFHIASFMR